MLRSGVLQTLQVTNDTRFFYWMKNTDQKICISLYSVNEHCFLYCSHLWDIDDWWQWGSPGTVPELIVQACCGDVWGERATAPTMSLRADYHPIPSQNGPDTDGSIRVTISGRLHCWTSGWVQKTGLDRTPVRFWVQREWGRQGWNQMFISSISEVTRDTVKLRKAKRGNTGTPGT